MKIEHYVERVVRKVSGSCTTAAEEIFAPDANGVYPLGDVVSITNTHASQIIYVQMVQNGTANTLSTSVYDEKIPAGESRQFQMRRPHRSDQSKTTRFYIYGSASGTTYTGTIFE